MNDDDRKLVLYIDAYSPETIPMAKLAEYMADFANLLGRENAVHFTGLEPGNTKIAARVEFEDLPKVRGRLNDIRRGDPPKDALKVFEQLDRRLANDNATGRIFIEETEHSAPADLLTFPGRTRIIPKSYGPFKQEGHLDGLLIAIGGKDDTVPIRLQNGEAVHTNCETSRSIARELGKHLFEPVRIHGTGTWTRESDGRWLLKRFQVVRFEVLGADSLADTVESLRAVRGNGWVDIADPLAELTNLRRDEDELH